VTLLPFAIVQPERAFRLDIPAVWPVISSTELSALRATAALFGADLAEVDAGAGRTRRAAAESDAVVAYPHAELRPLASLYAWLTGRRAALVTFERLERVAPEIVVCLWRHLTLERLERVHRASVVRPLGLIVARTPAQLRERVLCASAAAVLDPPPGGRILEVAGSDAAPGRSQFHRDDPPAAALLHLGHGDGLDLNFTRDEVLCNIREIVATGDASGRDIPCVRSGECYRLHVPIAAAMARADLLQPGDLRARAAVFLTCFGVPATDALVPPEWSFLEALLRSPALGCIVTSLGVTLPATSDIDALKGALTCGFPIGDALHRNPALSRNDLERCRLLLFGDPRTRPVLASRPPDGASPVRAAHPRLRRVRDEASPPWTPSARLRFLLDILTIARESHPDVDRRIAAVRSVMRTGRPRDAALIAHLEGLAPLWDHWTRRCELPVRCGLRMRCPGCGAAGRTFLYKWGSQTDRRTLSVCPRCGVVQDVEAGSPLVPHRPRVSGESVHIPDGAADAWVIVRHKNDLKQSARWTLAPGRGRSQQLVPAGAAIRTGAGLDMLNIVYLRGLEIASWEFKLQVRGGS